MSAKGNLHLYQLGYKLTGDRYRDGLRFTTQRGASPSLAELLFLRRNSKAVVLKITLLANGVDRDGLDPGTFWRTIEEAGRKDAP